MPCIGNVPEIVGTLETSQPSGGNVDWTSVFTPTATGLFRVSWCVTPATPSKLSSGAQFQVQYDDENGDQQIVAFTAALGPNGSVQNSVIIAGSGQSVYVQITGNVDTNAYSLYVVAEQLT